MFRIINLFEYQSFALQIMLHDQSEFPMIQDLGFAVAPGTHTLVGVHSSRVSDAHGIMVMCIIMLLEDLIAHYTFIF